MSSLLLLQVFTVPSYVFTFPSYVFTVQTAKRLRLGTFSGTVEYTPGGRPAARAAAGIDPVVKGQVRDAERNLRSYFRVAIIRAVSKARTEQ
jgi:hypothetical protein